MGDIRQIVGPDAESSQAVPHVRELAVVDGRERWVDPDRDDTWRETVVRSAHDVYCAGTPRILREN
jgi:hypothetical protein